MRLASCFRHTGRRRLACVGSKPEYANDELRKPAFLDDARKFGLRVSTKDVFEGTGVLAPIVEVFLGRLAGRPGRWAAAR